MIPAILTWIPLRKKKHKTKPKDVTAPVTASVLRTGIPLENGVARSAADEKLATPEGKTADSVV
jgi:hypothetical protein